ncbi:MAG: hypothetical protein ABSA12_08470 [Verrucomicrobiia bacterium]|jgi:uncharacterized protein YhbP (UPF0306 family)
MAACYLIVHVFGKRIGQAMGDHQQWHQIQGLQFRGVCQQLGNTERAWEVYSSRFPFLQQPNAILTRELTNTATWRIDTTWIRLMDNRINFGLGAVSEIVRPFQPSNS